MKFDKVGPRGTSADPTIYLGRDGAGQGGALERILVRPVAQTADA